MFRVSCFFLVCSLIWVAGCGGSGSSNPGNNSVTPSSASNTVAVGANGGPAQLVDGLFTSVTVCSPGTTNCATIGGILVDTGSSGLRIISSVLPSGFSLPQMNDSGGNPIAECTQFADGFSWGPVQMADMTVAGEKASNFPIQIINGGFASIPSTCSSNGPEEDTVATFGGNGVLGVGNFLQDCGPGCAVSGASNPGFYYSCPAAGCSVIAQPLAQQVPNPVALFATDNNGVIIELPSIGASGASTANGTLVFGIGTQSNNGLGNATVLALDGNGNFTTNFLGSSIPGSFVDSGSSLLFFPDNNLATCVIGAPPNNNTFYCPSSAVNLTATNQGGNNNSISTSFIVSNPNNVSGFAEDDIAAPDPSAFSTFDWGLPFFFGRNVFVAIEGKSTPGGTGPFTAY